MTKINSDTVQMDIAIEGMTCASCVARVERALKKVPGVDQATVNLATESARVSMVSEPQAMARLLRAVRDAGYEPHEIDDTQSTAKSTGASFMPVGIGLLLSAPLVVPMLASLWGGALDAPRLGSIHSRDARAVHIGCPLLQGRLARAQGLEWQHGLAGRHGDHRGLVAVCVVVVDGCARV